MKKDFTNANNPATAFFKNMGGTPEAAAPASQDPEADPVKEEAAPMDPEEEKPQKVVIIGKAPKGYKINPAYLETKSERVQIVLQPSIKKKLLAEAKKRKLSINETVTQAIIEFVEKEE